MRSTTYIFAILLSVSLLFSCSGDKKKSTEEGDKQAQEEPEVQKYAYQSTFTTLEWTAYKTSAKLGVKGTFNEFDVHPGKEEGTPLELMDQMTFSIPVSTTSSKDTSRDRKIVQIFFGSMMNTDNITGKFTRTEGNDSIGKAYISIKMNDVEHEVAGDYVIEDNKVTLKVSLDLGDWNAQPSVDALNKACKDLHTGEDGVSKLWPNVDLVIVSSLKPL